MRKLADLISSHEEWLMHRVLVYARERDYTRYTSTLAEAWRKSIAGLSEALLAGLSVHDDPPELGPDENFSRDPISAFGIEEARLHRERGVTLALFLGLMKYYRQSYIDLVRQAAFPATERKKSLRFVDRSFDRIELGFCTEWASPGETDRTDELQRANRRITKEKNKYLTIFESLRDPAALVGADNRIETVNHAWTETFLGGGTPGAQYYDRTPPEPEIPWLAGELAKLATGSGTEIGVERELDTLVGRRVFQIKLKRMLDVNEKFGGTVVILSDITELKRDEEELRSSRNNLDGQVREKTRDLAQANEQLQRARRLEAIGKLAGGISHDFNNILSAINGYSSFLEAQLSGQEAALEDVRAIQTAAERAERLTRQLLAFSRRQIRKLEIVSLNRVVMELSKMLGVLIGDDINLIPMLAEDLWNIKADRGQVEQIIMNLAVNARDAMPRGGRVIIETANTELDEKYVRINRGAEPGRYVMLAVTDTGSGMDEETQEKIFEPFFTTKEKGRGTGLGLSTVFGIVKQSGGNIWVYSEPGKGSTFKVYLPRTEESPIIALPKPKAAAPWKGTATILVVDNDDLLRAMARRALASGGFTVLEAENGHQAIALSRKHAGPIDLMITDVVMPGMSGKELADRLTVERPAMRLVYTSGYTENAIVHHGVLMADEPFLDKPFTVDALLNITRETLESAAAHS